MLSPCTIRPSSKHAGTSANEPLDSSTASTTARAQVRAQVQSEPIFNNWRFTIDIPLKIKRKWVKHIAELYRIPVELLGMGNLGD